MRSEHSTFAPSGTPVMLPPPADAPAPPLGHVPMQHTADPTAAPPSVVTSAMPPHGVTRGRSLTGRAPLIGLVLVIVLAAAGAAYGTGMFKPAQEPNLIVRGTPKTAAIAPKASTSASAAAAPATPAAKKPAAKAAVQPLVGKPVSVTKATSGTYAPAYSVVVPTDWTAEMTPGKRGPFLNNDLRLRNKPDVQLYFFASLAGDFSSPGPLTRAKYLKVKAAYRQSMAKVGEKSTETPGDFRTTVAGEVAYGWDRVIPSITPGSTRTYTERAIVFQHAGRLLIATMVTRTDRFSTATPVFTQLLATVQFAR
ncbi:MAG: hypothetical protein ABIM89_19030 [Mycobacteriales bacterium]